MTNDFSKYPAHILLHPANESNTAFTRVVAPGAALRSAGHAVTIGRMQFLTPDEIKIANPTSIVLQGQYKDFQLNAIKAYRKAVPKTHLVYELDDAVWMVNESNPAAKDIPRDVKRRIKTAISLVDSVTVTTEHLANTVRVAFKAKDVRVIPNHLTSRFINEAEAGRRSALMTSHAKLRVGWSGSVSHVDDIAFLKDVIDHFGNRIQWVFQGLLPAWVSDTNPNVEFHAPVPLADYPKSLGALNLDLALAPLLDGGFEREKSNLKVLEYGACRYAVLADKVQPYLNFPHVWHAAEHTPTAWINAIEDLIKSTTGLEAIGEKLSAFIKENYRLEDHLAEWQAAWLPKGATLFAPGAGSENRLFVRGGTQTPSHLQDRLEKHLGSLASVSCLNNEGLYPVPGSYSPIPMELAKQIDEAADFAGSDPVPAPYPTGPVVLLSGSALDRLGEPDVARYGSLEAAYLGWGARALEAGLGHAVAGDVFIASAEPVARDKGQAQAVINGIHLWTPFFVQAVSGYAEADPLAAARRNVEMSFIRREYTDGSDEMKPRLLMINPTEDQVKAAVADSLVFCAKLNGHFLHFDWPRMPNVAPIDTRDPIDSFIEVLGRLALPHIAFVGIGDGTIGAVGFLADVAEAGWRVDATIPETIDSRHHISQEQWHSVWAKLQKHQVQEEEAVVATDNA